ncbi:MAG: tRNA (adenosine(37)-N6)-dimethylallyltransferase MiaA [Acidobacteriaceae bacterium]|nr:tRNA (adenosine(37)-N6)-dimethylallyltransferase MiaA [Acidobacteriaceae bacterium]MBV9297041.1 tRNA (adenosine(37)-N6)-dimethylallyltransferase MiaA [Acidobacteriaceae bacterium]MBV9766331.1 tRNA (adenosine(37)-N6)-dimethylallyltransferase MiaA [Acidobacteriaceae bacterium]
MSPILVVLGATGTGKSEIGLALARNFAGEIISCDSVQVYRGLDVGSAKIPADQRRGVSHHLIDLIDPSEYMTAGAYSRLARDAAFDVLRKGKLPIVVGGTGFYLRALLEGLSPAPARDERLRARLRALAERRPGALHRLLLRRDPQAAHRIHPNDQQKLIRATELMLLSRQSATAAQSVPRVPLTGVTALKLGLNPDRKLLNQHLDQRCSWMFSHALLAETKALLDSGISPDAKSLQSLGYKQALKVLVHQFPLAEAVQECQIKTKQYAKRQATWFRREAGVHWLRGFGTESTIQREALEKTHEFLASFSSSK